MRKHLVGVTYALNKQMMREGESTNVIKEKCLRCVCVCALGSWKLFFPCLSWENSVDSVGETEDRDALCLWVVWVCGGICGNYGIENETKTITNSKPIYSRRSTLFRYWHISFRRIYPCSMFSLHTIKIEQKTSDGMLFVCFSLTKKEKESANAKCYASLILPTSFSHLFRQFVCKQ